MRAKAYATGRPAEKPLRSLSNTLNLGLNCSTKNAKHWFAAVVIEDRECLIYGKRYHLIEERESSLHTTKTIQCGCGHMRELYGFA
jgi:hypothetical protein